MAKHHKDKKAGEDHRSKTRQKDTEHIEAAEAQAEFRADENGENPEAAADRPDETDRINEATSEAGPEQGAAEVTTEEDTPEEKDVTEPARTIEVDEEEMLFTRRKVKNLEGETRKLSNELETLKERMLRLTAEYENFRNRTAREKEEIEAESVAKVLADILPVMDNLERALVTETDDLPGLKDGVQLTLDQFIVAMQKLGVELIPTDSGFDPEYHEAVMHERDETKGEKEITEVFLKGYKKGEKVVRHSVVKVVN